MNTDRVYNNPLYIFLVVVGMTLVGLYLRVYNLGWQCLKVDEMVTQTAVAKSTSEIVHWALTVDYNPPLYYLAAHYSSLFFGGASAFALRFPAALCSTALIPLSYILGKTMKNTSLGYLMAGTAVFLFPYFFYAQDARAYPMVLMFLVAFLCVYVKVWNDGFNPMRIFLLGGTIAGCLWSHYYVALPIAILMLFMVQRFYRDRVEFQPLRGSFLIAFLLLLPLLLSFDYSQFASRTNHGVFNVLWNTPSLIAISVVNEMLCWSWLLLVPLAVYTLWKYRKEETVFVPFAVAIVISILFLIPMAHFTAVMPRYALVSTPMILLMVMYPVSILVESQKTVQKRFALVVLFLLAVFALNYGSIYQWLTYSICPMMAL